MLVALVSARGSPGVTTAALALTLTWPSAVVLAEVDPAGGTILPGYLAGVLPADRGIRELAVAALRGDDLAAVWWGQLIDLAPPARQRLLLPGITDPAAAGALAPVWDQLAAWLASLGRSESGHDVLADCGRLVSRHTPWPLLAAADAVLLVLPATLAGLAAATPAVAALRSGLAGHRPAKLGLLLCGRADQSTRTVAAELGTPVVSILPHDPRTARVLSDGGTLRGGALLRAAAESHQHLRGHLRRATAAAMQRAGEPT
ncbi:MAG: ParA family protein [Natronosporangium sp.]